MSIRVLNICETATGGVATYLNVMSEIPSCCVEQISVVPESHLHSLNQGMTVITYPAKRRGAAALFSMITALRRARREVRPDIVFFHSTFALLALCAMRLVDRKQSAIYCPHGWAISRYGKTSIKGRLVRVVEGLLSGLSDVVVNVSHEDAKMAERLGYRGRHLVIENAVAEAVPNARDDLFAAEPEATHLLFVGRFDHQKGLDVLLDAFALARRARPDLRLHLIGAKVRAEGEVIVLPECADLSGWVDPKRIDDWYRSADALVVPSRWEGFGLVVPEALRNGTPVLVSDRGALPGLIDPGKTGQVFPLDANSLAKCLINLDRSKLRAMRPAARDSYEARFHVERLHKELIVLYRDLLQ